MFHWKKRGLIFSPSGERPWMSSHAQVPFSLDLGTCIRVYFSTREAYRNNMTRAYGGFVDLERRNLKNVLRVASEPILPLGGAGAFDEFGIMPCSVVRHNGEYRLYYAGWSRAVSVPYTWAIGYATSTDGEHFQKHGRGGPLLGATGDEPYLQGCPMVYKIAENDWHMFYLSGIQWLHTRGQMESQYSIMHATSQDGIHWQRDGKPVIKNRVELESQTTGAIIRLDNQYHMFFSYRHSLDFREERGRGYLIGYARSDDLFTWTRDDTQVGIALSETGWDADMITYPHITRIDGKIILFYCGNEFGKDGFGYAELEM
ncbi:MAG: hypothetical protein LBK01_01760 [Burkholderiaceae bacterium]|nr:hypothetical protein [Burkholderiaceae bacterium]